MSNLQSVSIIAAFPIGFVILLIAVSFVKDANAFLQNGACRTLEKKEDRVKEE